MSSDLKLRILETLCKPQYQIQIDLNSDLGEHPGSNLDQQIMPFISSCNIACGGHAGNAASVEQTIYLAMQYGVAVGAHPAYPDRENFGRTIMNISKEALEQTLLKQILLVKQTCERLGTKLHHVKPHGALYNEAAKNSDLSNLICGVMKEIGSEVKLYGLAHSLMQNIATGQGIEFIAEGFADRQYEPDKSLRSRKKEAAVLSDAQEVLRQVEEMAINQRVFADNWIGIEAQSICLHSDTKGAVNLAEKIRNHLEFKGVHVVAV